MLLVKTLLADDHALIRAGLRDALNDLPGVEIVGEVGNGPDLFAALARLEPDLLVMDVNMPDFEPVAAVRQIVADFPELKILVVSAYDDQSYVVGLLSAGVDGYHLKDQPLTDLQLAVRRILDGGRWISDPLVNRLVDRQSAAPPDPASQLTRRQCELLYLLSQGYSNQKIALVMGLSVKTVENHLTALYRAIGVESRLEANNYASRHPETLVIPAQEHGSGKPAASNDALSVLLVDDNPRYRVQLGKLLSRACPTTTLFEAGNCAEATQLARQVRPRLAFVDVLLQDDDGIKCVRQIKEISPATRSILISAYPDREFRRMGLSAGAVAFLDKKDIDAAAVRQLIEDLL